MASKMTDENKRRPPSEILREKKTAAFLERISQDEEMITLLTAERAALMGENMVDLTVKHRQYGPGQISGQDSLTVTVRFENGTKRFPIPDGFLKGYLETGDVALSQRLKRCQQIDRQIRDLKNDISEADHVIQLLKK